MASVIRVNTVNSRSGLSTVTFDNSGAGIEVSGIVTATSFSGTSSGNPTLTNGANNRVITATGANAIQGESTLTYNGSQLSITGVQNSYLNNNILSFDRAGYSYIDQLNDNGSLVFRVTSGYTNALRLDPNAQAIFGSSLIIPDAIQHAGDLDCKIRFPATDTISFETASNERLRIDSSGHMGLGVTPNANWPTNGDFKALQIGTGIAVFGRGSGDEDRGGISANLYSTGSGWKYLGNGHAGRIYFEDGSIVFNNTGSTANSSGANAAATLEETLRIDSSGNVMMGRNSASKKFSLRETSTSTGVHIVQTIGGANHVSAYAVGLGFDPEGYAARTKIAIVAEGTGSGYSRGKLHFLLDSANDSGEATISESRMTITDSGKVGINETSPAAQLDVKGSGVPIVINSSNSNTYKVQLENAGSTVAYIGAASNEIYFANSSAAEQARFTDTGLKFPNGKGINFAATGGASGVANHLLDDYEEGSWDPGFYPESSAMTINYNLRTGSYVKIGRVVYWQFRMRLSSMSGASTNQTVGLSGLPFTVDSAQPQFSGAIYGSNWSGEMPVGVFYNGGTTRGSFYYYGSNQQYSNNYVSDMNLSTNGSYTAGSGFYFVA